MSSNRRREPRYVVDWPALARWGDRTVKGRLINASASGALLAVHEQDIDPDATLTLEVKPGAVRRLVEAKVCWRAQIGSVWSYGLSLPEGVLASETADLTPILMPRND